MTVNELGMSIGVLDMVAGDNSIGIEVLTCAQAPKSWAKALWTWAQVSDWGLEPEPRPKGPMTWTWELGTKAWPLGRHKHQGVRPKHWWLGCMGRVPRHKTPRSQPNHRGLGFSHWGPRHRCQVPKFLSKECSLVILWKLFSDFLNNIFFWI